MIFRTQEGNVDTDRMKVQQDDISAQLAQLALKATGNALHPVLVEVRG